MKIEKIQVLRGPNIWSIRRKKLIQMRLDLEEMEQSPTNKIPGFRERLENIMPSLYSHRCSEGKPGGLFQRIEMGTWMGHVIEHIALELQTLAGMDTGFGRTRETKTPGVYNVVFSYIEENAGVMAAKEAVKLAECVIDDRDYDLQECIFRLKQTRERERLGPSTGSIVEEAESRNIPWIRLGKNSLVQLGYGIHQQRFQATITGNTSSIAVDIACNKELTKKMLDEAAIPVPKGGLVYSIDELESTITKIGYPIVLKPLDGNHGRGQSINVNDWDTAVKGFELAQQISSRVIVERFITGYDFRVLVVNHKMVAAARRMPANVVGDGERTISQLIDIENKDPRRGYGHENMLTEIVVDSSTLDLLEKNGFHLESVPQKGEIVFLKSTANLSTGGTSSDVTDMIHPDNITMCERISKIIGLDVCGIDIMAENLTQPLKETGGCILEVNAAPGFRMHLSPSDGLPRNVAAPVVDMLYPPGKPYRIPIIAVTGTNGKTTTTRLISHIVKNNGYRVGFTTSDGIYIQNTLLTKGDTTGPVSAEFILKDPTVEFAVLETARGGILRSGLGFGTCDIGVLTNIKEDHLGMNDIHSLRDLTRVKRVVLDSVKKSGWCILNADDEYSMRLSGDLDAKVALFSLDENNPHIVKLSREGKTTCVYEEGFVTIKKGDWKIRITKVQNIPITMEGKAKFMISNVLAASLATYLYGFAIEDIAMALRTFIPSAQLTPGRLNVFKFKNFKVMIDFAHNPAGYEAIAEYLSNVEATKKIGIISGVGDRRDEDIRKCGQIAGQMFDYIIIRNEKHLRGRTEDEINGLIIDGINSSGRNVSYECIPKEIEALKHAMGMAEEGTFITALSDVVDNAIDLVQDYQHRESQEENNPN
ncbi:cyanophycin synthetase [Planobacterium oryzisoli]|uniref:Cyanophycin synthetase n=1 Tax=Planobacterium oryzisoli TaxID=2771435 RepID=A0A930YTX8_9FLAO|nr:cyanophycin synthetase [Planobacterium oryzisoli]MBF5026298.1 cyanophycin synthetase [Planobacterium oryzisoli]